MSDEVEITIGKLALNQTLTIKTSGSQLGLGISHNIIKSYSILDSLGNEVKDNYDVTIDTKKGILQVGQREL